VLEIHPLRLEYTKRNIMSHSPFFQMKYFSIHKCIGEVRTPYFLGVKINDDGTHRIFYSQLGKFKGAELFLELMLQESGLKQER